MSLSWDDSDLADVRPDEDDVVKVPLGFPALGLEGLGRRLLTLPGVVCKKKHRVSTLISSRRPLGTISKKVRRKFEEKKVHVNCQERF